jgi:hypothetical protein
LCSHCTHTGAPLRARSIEMEVAALVLFGSIALWLAEEFNDNQF